MTFWGVATVGFWVAFMVHGVRAAWRAEPSRHWWRKLVAIKEREWTWLDFVLLGGFVGCLVLSGNGDILLDPTPDD